MAIGKDFGFLTRRLCLDFAQTGDMGYGSRFERLKNPAELQRWFSLSSLRLARVRATMKDLARARKLRSAIWRVANSLLERKMPNPRDVRLINAIAREPGLVLELNLAANVSQWHRPATPAALATIAQDAVALFGDAASRARLRRCGNPKCLTVFYDDSRPGRRRWCAPNRCGDRIRAKAYRQRQQLRRSQEK